MTRVLMLALAFVFGLSAVAHADVCKVNGKFFDCKPVVAPKGWAPGMGGGGRGGFHPGGGGGGFHHPGGGGGWRPPGGMIPWGGHHGPSYGNAGGALIGGILGYIIGREVAPEPAPVIIEAQPPEIAVAQADGVITLKPWTTEWYDYCNTKWRTFDAKTGFYQGADGVKHFCH